jgi:hypothetical protein
LTFFDTLCHSISSAAYRARRFFRGGQWSDLVSTKGVVWFCVPGRERCRVHADAESADGTHQKFADTTPGRKVSFAIKVGDLGCAVGVKGPLERPQASQKLSALSHIPFKIKVSRHLHGCLPCRSRMARPRPVLRLRTRMLTRSNPLFCLGDNQIRLSHLDCIGNQILERSGSIRVAKY